MERYLITVYGKVQGVGFRYFVSYAAKAMDLTGWVKNCDDGSVELEVQGNKENLSLFVERLKKGNGYSRVDDMYVTNLNVLKEERSFKVAY